MDQIVQAEQDRTRPLIGITADRTDTKYSLAQAYVSMVERASGVPIVLPCHPPLVTAHAALCDGFILTGGDDPIMEAFGITTDPRAKPIHPDRQAFELALLDLLARDRPQAPVLAICLGMQLLGLHAGGTLDQHLKDHLPSFADHLDDNPHPVRGEIGAGVVKSHHRQALTDAGRLRVIGRAPDGVIEAIDDPDRPFYVGVQWHPERSDDQNLGLALFQRLVAAARA